MRNRNHSAELFSTGFVQVFFVAINTYLIANKVYLAVFLCAFCISFIWSWNVKKVAFGSLEDRLYYSLGAATGSMIGCLLISYIV